MAYTLGNNKCTKNCCKRTILVQLIVENIVTCFLRHSVGPTVVCVVSSACRSVCDRRYSHHLQHHARHVPASVHVCCYRRSAVQGSSSRFLVADLNKKLCCCREAARCFIASCLSVVLASTVQYLERSLFVARCCAQARPMPLCGVRPSVWVCVTFMCSVETSKHTSPLTTRDEVRYWSKIAIFFIPHLHSMPLLGENIWRYVYSFRHNTRTWQTDRQTDIAQRHRRQQNET